MGIGTVIQVHAESKGRPWVFERRYMQRAEVGISHVTADKWKEQMCAVVEGVVGTCGDQRCAVGL